jgi:hypothetical protein
LSRAPQVGLPFSSPQRFVADEQLAAIALNEMKLARFDHTENRALIIPGKRTGFVRRDHQNVGTALFAPDDELRRAAPDVTLSCASNVPIIVFLLRLILRDQSSGLPYFLLIEFGSSLIPQMAAPKISSLE